jgi:hypothetical protein
MPIALNTESTRAFCDEVGVTFSDLVEQADAMDINVALVDDFIDQSMADRKPSA